MLILMVIYLVAFSQRWDETISFFPKKCTTNLSEKILFFSDQVAEWLKLLKWISKIYFFFVVKRNVGNVVSEIYANFYANLRYRFSTSFQHHFIQTIFIAPALMNESI
jgi:hypothetical protein